MMKIELSAVEFPAWHIVALGGLVRHAGHLFPMSIYLQGVAAIRHQIGLAMSPMSTRNTFGRAASGRLSVGSAPRWILFGGLIVQVIGILVHCPASDPRRHALDPAPGAGMSPGRNGRSLCADTAAVMRDVPPR